jgi:hypothetical protein
MLLATPLLVLVLNAAPSAPYVHFGVDRGTRRAAAASDELVSLRVEELASGQSFHCTEARELSSIQCSIASGSFVASGKYSIVVENPPKVSGAIWVAHFTLPKNVSTVALEGYVSIGATRPGLVLASAAVVVAPESLVQLSLDPVPTAGSRPPVFKFMNGSAHAIAVEVVGDSRIGRLYRTDEFGALERFVGPLDECFAPGSEYTSIVKASDYEFIGALSSFEPLVPGRYLFVVRYRRASSVRVFSGGDFPRSEAEIAFEVK